MKSGMALERAHIGRKQAEADRAAAITVIDAVDQRRQFLAPVIVGREEVRLVVGGGHQVEQHHANAERLVPRDPLPELVEAGEQESVSRVSWKSVSSHQPPRSPVQDRCTPRRRQ